MLEQVALKKSTGTSRQFFKQQDTLKGAPPPISFKHQRKFLIATVPPADIDHSPHWIEFGLAKQYYATKWGYKAEVLINNRVSHATSEAYVVLGEDRGGGATRCELLKPLLVHDALLRHHGNTS